MPAHEIVDEVTLDNGNWLSKYYFAAWAEVNLGDESVGLAPHLDSEIKFRVFRVEDFRFGACVMSFQVRTSAENYFDIHHNFKRMLSEWEVEAIGQSIVDGCVEKYFEKKRGCQGRLKAVP